MNNFMCPFCGIVFACTDATFHSDFSSFAYRTAYDGNYSFNINYYKCPHCDKISVVATGKGACVVGSRIWLNPTEARSRFVVPDYVPAAIRTDYEEAFKILSLSPKASATLARRCLQGMIHDFWNVHQKNLNAEITALKEIIPADQWAAIDAVRKIGNIGAHMEHDINLIVDIDSDEADRILRLIELLIKDWYIARHDREELLKEIIAISDEKAALRKQDR